MESLEQIIDSLEEMEAEREKTLADNQLEFPEEGKPEADEEPAEECKQELERTPFEEYSKGGEPAQEPPKEVKVESLMEEQSEEQSGTDSATVSSSSSEPQVESPKETMEWKQNEERKTFE